MDSVNVTAIILAGGKGTRMAPYEGHKSVVPLNGTPMICRQIRHLQDSGVRDVVVCTGHRKEDVENALRGWNVRFSHLPAEASMTERITEAAKAAASKILVCYGDEYADVSIRNLTARHAMMGRPITVTVYPFEPQFGLFLFTLDYFGMEIDKAPRFVEKRHIPGMWINIGFVLMDRDLVKLMIPGDGLSRFLSEMNEDRKTSFYRHRGLRVTVNTLADLEAAQEVVK